MNLPKTDDNHRTRKNNTNIRKNDTNDTPSWHIVNTSFWTSASCEQFKSLVSESGRLCASSNIVL